MTVTSDTSLFSYVSCRQSYGIGLTFIDPVPFLDLRLLYVQ